MPGGEREVRMEEYERLREQARTITLFAGLPPSAVLERKHDMRPKWTVMAFSILWSRPSPNGGERAPHWVARIVEADGSRLRTAYADSRSCAELRAVLIEAEKLEPPRPRFVFVDSRRDDGAVDGITLHDTDYWLSTQARSPGGSSARVELRSGSRSPVATWAETSMDKLAPCWSDRIPPVH
jgi:hypothetical protein